MSDFSPCTEVIFFRLKTKYKLVVAVIREKRTEYFYFTQSTIFKKALPVIALDVQVAPVIRKAQCQLTEPPRDPGAAHPPLVGPLRPTACTHLPHPGKEPAPGSRGREDQPPSHRTSKSDHSWASRFIWAEGSWSSPSMQQSWGKKGCIPKVIWKSCFCCRGENLETRSSSKSPINIQD